MKKSRILLLLLIIIITGGIHNAIRSTSVEVVEVKNYTTPANNKIKTAPVSPLQLINLLNRKLNFTSPSQKDC
jgi:hypothetical protein